LFFHLLGSNKTFPAQNETGGGQKAGGYRNFRQLGTGMLFDGCQSAQISVSKSLGGILSDFFNCNGNRIQKLYQMVAQLQQGYYN
jgi:hypothetical protein